MHVRNWNRKFDPTLSGPKAQHHPSDPSRHYLHSHFVIPAIRVDAMGCILRPPLGSQIGLHEFQCVVFWFQSRTSGFVNTGTGSHDRAAHRRTARTEICTSTSPAKTGTTRDKQKCSRISSPVVFLCPSTPVLNDLPEPILVKWQRQMESGHKRARLAACKPKPRHCDALKHFFKLSKSLRGLVTFISEASRLITKSLCKFGHS